eukprot:snap_masked-scaffold_1-processed-gene-17.12-mRNA-1 protein AED:0.14 eAED:0.14 QI:0/-1/0/1/-1/1/1/0/291
MVKSTLNTENFVGFDVEQSEDYIKLSTEKYVKRLNTTYDIKNVKKRRTPHQSGVYLFKSENPIDNTLYQSIIGSLSFIARITRPDISYICRRLSVFNANPGVQHLRMAKKVLKYLYEYPKHGIVFRKNAKEDIFELYTDSSWANVPGDASSIGGFILKWNGTPISWASKKQKTVAKSSTEAEAMSMATGVSTMKWFKNLLRFFNINEVKVKIFCDNASAILIMKVKNITDKSRHMDIKYFFTRQVLKRNDWSVQHIEGDIIPADILTKPVSVKVFEHTKSWLFSEESKRSA